MSHKAEELDIEDEGSKILEIEDDKGLYTNPRLDQSDPSVRYMLSAGSLDRACGACRWYRGEGYCHLVDSEPLSITAIGTCGRFEADADADILDALEDVVEDMIEGELPKISVLDLLKQALGVRAETDMSSAFKVLEDGKHWIGRWSNNFEDRQKQLFSEKAIDEYIGRVRAGEVPYPELWFFHIPGTRHGVAEKLWRSGHFAWAYGSFDNSDIAKKFVSHYHTTNKKSRGMSHGFWYPPSALQQGVYEKFTSFELTVLPPKYAANPYTTFKTYEEIANMKGASAPADVQAELKEILGADAFAAIVGSDESQGKALEEAGVRFKADEESVTLENKMDLVLDAVGKLANEVVSMKATHAASEDDDEEDGKTKKSADEPIETDGEKSDEVSNADVLAAISELTGTFKTFFGLQPRPTQHPNTLLNMRDEGDKKQADYLQKKQQEAQQGKSVVTQIAEGGFQGGWGPLGPGNVPD